MNGLAWVLLLATGAAALVDWFAVSEASADGTGEERSRLEDIAKPATLALLLLTALALEPADGGMRTWFVVALAFGLAGDVFLLRPQTWFVQGLAAFLVGHLAYAVGFVVGGMSGAGLLLGAVAVAAMLAFVGRRVVEAVRDAEPALATPVTAYVGVISLMVLTAFGSGDVAAVVGAGLFAGSDALIADNRFGSPRPWGRIAVITTYHLGQILLVVSLL